MCDMHLCVDIINSVQTKIYKWATEYGLSINPSKLKCILLNSSGISPMNGIILKMDDNIIEFISRKFGD